MFSIIRHRDLFQYVKCKTTTFVYGYAVHPLETPSQDGIVLSRSLGVQSQYVSLNQSQGSVSICDRLNSTVLSVLSNQITTVLKTHLLPHIHSVAISYKTDKDCPVSMCDMVTTFC